MGKQDVRSNQIKHFGRLIFFYLLFVCINIVANRAVGALGLPLFIDNIGTLLAAIFGGYLPGIVVGYVTNLVNSTADPANAYYAVLSVLIAVAGTFFARKGYFEKIGKALLTIPVFAFLGGFLGSILTYLLYGFGMGEGISAPFAAALLEKGTLSVFWAQMISDVTIDLVDKAITVGIVFILVKLIPKKFSDTLALTNWKQRPMSKEDIGRAKRTDTKGMSLRGKIIFVIAFIMVFIAFGTTAISYVLYKAAAIEQYTFTGRNVASLAASSLDAELVDDYLEKADALETDAELARQYQATKARLYSIRESSPNIEYIYVYQIRPDGCHVVFDLDTEDLEGAALGEVIPFDDSFSALLPTLLAGGNIDPIITDDTYGWLLTDYEPVYDETGKCVCYACTDINMQEVRLDRVRFLTKVTSLFIGFFILILVLGMWISEYHLIYPLDAMTFAARKFAFDSEETLEIGVERLKSLDIATGDEIENLYESLSKTMSQTVEYIDDVQKKGEEIARMQNGLIYILADLVESRDKCTGDHVRKTAAYVKLILQLMKENNLYPDILTDEYIADVCNSAPLHDVGKIKVSDVILNKPARLTDEEFEIMQTHTTEGKAIIESAMKLTTDPGYLKEALNLATYHHEKWNGQGYPTGLAGEDIPLSARIMAISDVFDALVSRRSYKKPFTLDEALKIIEEGAGTHFDPVIAKLFVDNRERVKEIMEEHQRERE
ncbi:MAG: HD domain-containing protein [Lachnospiraceae bacterium]|nr:HD domain-containing protein [Lachnospiraceae bacterium]